MSQLRDAEPVVDSALLQRLSGFLGKGADRPGFSARSPISIAAIRQMTDAVGDRNPVYTDEAFAGRTVHRGLVAPPMWLYTWMMPGLEPEQEQPCLEDGTSYFHLAPGGQRRPLAARATIRDELNQVLESNGFTSPAVTDMRYEFFRYLRPGETPRFSSWSVDEISAPKATKLGVGFFITLSMNVFVGEERVASIRQRYLRFKPDAGAEPAAAKGAGAEPSLRGAPAQPVLRLGPSRSRTDSTLRFSDVKAGDMLPPLVVKISPTLVIAGALASQDFQDVHHDFEIMQERGHPGIFMNMMTTSGLLGRFVTDWTGPEARIRAHELRLMRPNYPGDTMRLTGIVRTARLVDGHGLLEVDLLGTNGLGKHTESSVVVELPANGGR